MPNNVQSGLYAQDFSVAYAGMLQNDNDVQVDNFVAAGTIRSGAAVELVSGLLQECQSGNTTNFVGVAKYMPSKEPGTAAGEYVVNDVVPVVRRGKVYSIFSGGSKTAGGAINIACSTDGSHNQGTFTATATSSTTGAEIAAASTNTKFGLFDNTGSTSLALVELNLP